MAIKDLTIKSSAEVSTENSRKKREMSLSVHRNIRSSQGFDRVAVGAAGASNDRAALESTKRVLGKQVKIAEGNAAEAKEISKRGAQIHRVIADSASSQNQHLASIDSTLKQINADTQRDRMKAERIGTEAKVRRIKDEEDDMAGRPKRKKKKLSDQLKEAKETGKELMKDKMTIGNFLKYGAAIASLGFDAFTGSKKAGEWGTNPLMGGVVGLLAGSSGKGGMTNAIKKAVDVGTLGGMLAGPIGALFGTIIGGLLGYIGSENFIGFINDTMNRIFETVFEKMTRSMEILIAKVADTVETRFDKIFLPIKDFFSTLTDKIDAAFHKIMSVMYDKAGSAIKNIAKIVPGSLGDYMSKIGDDMKQESLNHSNASEKALQSKRDKEKKNADEVDQNELKRLAFREGLEDDNDIFKIWSTKQAEAEAESAKNKKKKSPTGGDGEEPEIDISALMKAVGFNYESPKGGGGEQQKKSTVKAPKKGPSVMSAGANSPTVVGPKTKDDPSKKQFSYMNVGEVLGSEIKDAADKINSMSGTSGNITEKITPEALAAIIQRESGGQKKVKDGDSGQSVGIAQMKDVALIDVNKAFGTSFTHQQVKSDYKAALEAAGLYYKLQLNSAQGDMKTALGNYNRGVSKQLYADDLLSKIKKFQANNFDKDNAPDYNYTPQSPTMVPPQPSNKGVGMISGMRENAQLKEAQKGSGTTLAPVVTSVNTVTNNKETVQMNMPDTRNGESTWERMQYDFGH
jgi:hypothetical protein